MEGRSHEMVQALKERPENLGFCLWQNEVVIVSPGSPISLSPTAFAKADLDDAISGGLLVERKLSGSIELMIYAAR